MNVKLVMEQVKLSGKLKSKMGIKKWESNVKSVRERERLLKLDAQFVEDKRFS